MKSRFACNPPAAPEPSLAARLKFFMNPWDGRYEDLRRGPVALHVLRDFTAGLIVAMVAIPLAMGFAMASGLRPEQGIVGGAVAGLVGALFGGSKYQVYGPTAAFIPILGAMMTKHGYDFLALCSLVAGVILAAMGLARVGRLAGLVPHSIIVGFTIGIAIVIGTSQLGEALGIQAKMGYGLLDKLSGVASNLGAINGYAIAVAGMTLVLTRALLKASPYVPAPLLAVGAATLLSCTVWADKGLVLIRDRYGSIPTDFFVLTLPGPVPLSAQVILDLAYYATAIVFVAAVESVLCSRMADRLADNKGLPFNPNKELWGQGLVNIVVPLFNGFPHTGALARTATNIKVGALSPLAGIFKFGLKLLMAFFLARHLEVVPMACIAGILLFVALGMVKLTDVTEVRRTSRPHVALMVYTAVMVPLFDFLTGVLSALILYAIFRATIGEKGSATSSAAR